MPATMTSDLLSLHAAAIAAPDDAGLRNALTDWCEENPDQSPFCAAVAEFAGLYREPRRYKTQVCVAGPTDEIGDTRRRALSGWREWLSEGYGATWYQVLAEGGRGGAVFFGQNWHRLCPALWSLLAGADRWRRQGGRVEVERAVVVRPSRETAVVSRVTLHFAHGWVTRAVFRDHQSASALLPALLRDQPFAECGIVGMPIVGQHDSTGNMGAALFEEECGPAYDLIGPTGSPARGYFRPGPRNDAAARAQAALSAALRKHALEPRGTE